MRRVEHVRTPAPVRHLAAHLVPQRRVMNNEVPGASVPADSWNGCGRRRRARGHRGSVKIAHETFARVRGAVAGVQLAAPLGRIDGALSILDTHAA